MIKIKNSVLYLATSVFLLFAVSCETTKLNLLDSPNSLQPEQADVDFFLNSMEQAFARFVTSAQREPAQLMRMKHMFGPTYDNAYSPTDFDTDWSIYNSVLADVTTVVPLAESKGLFIHAGMAKIMQAYIMVTLVDLFGDVPYTEATDPNILNPKVDKGSDIYDAMLVKIDDAIADFNKTSVALPTNDLFYGGDAGKWIKLANSLKLKIYLTRSLVDPQAKTEINTLIAGNNIISDKSDDFEFPWGTENLNPDSRYPRFGPNYDNASSSNDYMSTYYMWAMLSEKGFQDPRMRYYFYRQVNQNTSDINEQPCVTKPKPPQFGPNDPWCNPNHPQSSFGYWGRNHADNDGIPPDDFLKTTFGLYPAGGQFDADQAAPVKKDMGAAGAGISPIILANYVHFMRASAALELGTTDNARTQLELAIRASMDKVTNFAPQVNRMGFDATLPADIQNYVTKTLAAYDAATASGKLEIVIKEYYLALFGNGLEAYNNYRRTSFPSGLQPTVTASPGAFIRSFIYPSNFVNLNINATQKPNNTVKVFWDTNANPLK